MGHYKINENVQVELWRVDDFLAGSMTGFGETDFLATGETEFWSRASGATVKFELDDAGKVVRAVLRVRGQEMVATPVTDPPG